MPKIYEYDEDEKVTKNAAMALFEIANELHNISSDLRRLMHKVEFVSDYQFEAIIKNLKEMKEINKTLMLDR